MIVAQRHIGEILPAGCDGRGPPLILLLSQRRMSDYRPRP
jgi:hypothetical protein